MEALAGGEASQGTIPNGALVSQLAGDFQGAAAERGDDNQSMRAAA